MNLQRLDYLDLEISHQQIPVQISKIENESGTKQEKKGLRREWAGPIHTLSII